MTLNESWYRPTYTWLEAIDGMKSGDGELTGREGFTNLCDSILLSWTKSSKEAGFDKLELGEYFWVSLDAYTRNYLIHMWGRHPAKKIVEDEDKIILLFIAVLRLWADIEDECTL